MNSINIHKVHTNTIAAHTFTKGVDFNTKCLRIIGQKKELWHAVQQANMLHLQAYELILDYVFCLSAAFFIQSHYVLKTEDIKLATCISDFLFSQQSLDIIKLTASNIVLSVLGINNVNDIVIHQWQPSNHIQLLAYQLDSTNYQSEYTMRDVWAAQLPGGTIIIAPNINKTLPIQLQDSALLSTPQMQLHTVSCNEPTITLQGTCAQAITTPSACTYCMPRVEFFENGTCHVCDVQKICPPGTVKEECCGIRDTTCVPVQNKKTETCMNGIHDYDEECDPTDTNSLLSTCCSSVCTLMPGYYMTPPCQTVCGDNIKAGIEQCDTSENAQCDIFTCTHLKSNM